MDSMDVTHTHTRTLTRSLEVLLSRATSGADVVHTDPGEGVENWLGSTSLSLHAIAHIRSRVLIPSLTLQLSIFLDKLWIPFTCLISLFTSRIQGKGSSILRLLVIKMKLARRNPYCDNGNALQKSGHSGVEAINNCHDLNDRSYNKSVDVLQRASV